MEWIKSNWEVIVGTLGIFFGGLYLPGVRVLLVAGVRAIVSEAVMVEFLIQMAEKLVKSTKNTLDDVWLEEMKSRV